MLVGRAVERERLVGAFAAAARGAVTSIVVTGGAGIGKSRLVEDALAATTGATVLRTCASEGNVHLAYGSLQDVLLPLLDLPATRPRPTRPRARPGAGTGRTGPLGAVAPTALAVRAGVLDLLGRTSQREPLLIVVDDAHWADQESLAARRSPRGGSATRGSASCSWSARRTSAGCHRARRDAGAEPAGAGP